MGRFSKDTLSNHEYINEGSLIGSSGNFCGNLANENFVFLIGSLDTSSHS